MLILDEQLLGRKLEEEIGLWYSGPVLSIRHLRPGTLIKDDGIPTLLHQEQQATFITINVQHFWRKVPIDARFCVVCFPLPIPQAIEIPARLRTVFALTPFRSKAARMGKVLWVDAQ